MDTCGRPNCSVMEKKGKKRENEIKANGYDKRRRIIRIKMAMI